MAAEYQDVRGNATGVTLDDTPPPPDNLKRASNSKRTQLGEFSSNPGIQMLQGLGDVQNGIQRIAAMAKSPAMNQLLSQFGILLTQLQQLIPQELSGGRSPFVPSAGLAPPMGAPPPPGIGAAGGAPPAPTPLPPGMGMPA